MTNKLDHDKAAIVATLTRAIYLLQIDNNQQGKNLLRAGLSAAASSELPDLYEISREDLAFLLSRALKYNIEPEYSKKIADYHFISIEVEIKSDLPDWPVRIEILNHLLLVIDGVRTNFTQKINLSHFRLLVSLIANGDGKLSIEKLKENLWPGRSEEKKSHRFYVAVTQLRKLIGVDSILFRGNKILLNRRRCWVDTLAFKTILKDLQNHNMGDKDDIYDLKHDIENAMSTYQNNFLVGTDDFYWRKNLAHDSKTIIIDTVLKLGAVLEKNLDTDAALSLYRAAMDIDNLNENLYAKSMHCLSILGNLSEAEHVFQNYKNRLIENDRPLPSQRLKTLHQQIFSQHHTLPGNA